MIVFSTGRLFMRSWTPDDAEAAFSIYGDPVVARFAGRNGQPERDVESQRASLARVCAMYDGRTDGLGFWAIELRSTGEIVGSALLKPLEQGPDIEVGWHLARRAWGNGYATEAGAGALRYGFEVLSLYEIVAVVHPENPRSLRVAERLGMRPSGQRHCYGHDLRFFVRHPPV